MKKFLITLALALGIFSGTAIAADKYTYVGGSYSASDVRDRSYDRGTVEASVSVTDNWYVAGAYVNGFDRDFDAGVAKVTVGAHNTINDAGTVDLFGQVSGLAVVADRGDFSKYNYEAQVGIRHQVTPRVETRFAAIATNLRDRRFEDVKYFGSATVEYAITDSFRLNVGYVGSRDYNEGNIGARWYF